MARIDGVARSESLRIAPFMTWRSAAWGSQALSGGSRRQIRWATGVVGVDEGSPWRPVERRNQVRTMLDAPEVLP